MMKKMKNPFKRNKNKMMDKPKIYNKNNNSKEVIKIEVDFNKEIEVDSKVKTKEIMIEEEVTSEEIIIEEVVTSEEIIIEVEVTSEEIIIEVEVSMEETKGEIEVEIEEEIEVTSEEETDIDVIYVQYFKYDVITPLT